MVQTNEDIKAGQIMLAVKNEDGSYSPLSICARQAAILNRLLGYFSELEPFVVNREFRLVIDK